MYEYYWSEGQYVVRESESGMFVDSFTDLDTLLEEYPEAVEM